MKKQDISFSLLMKQKPEREEMYVVPGAHTMWGKANGSQF